MIEKGLSENGYTLAPCPLPGTIMMRWTTVQLKSELAVGPADPGTIMMRWSTARLKSALAVGPADRIARRGIPAWLSALPTFLKLGVDFLWTGRYNV